MYVGACVYIYEGAVDFSLVIVYKSRVILVCLCGRVYVWCGCTQMFMGQTCEGLCWRTVHVSGRNESYPSPFE